MRVARWVLIACLALAVGCSSGNPGVTSSESEDASEVTQASESPSAEPTETPSPTEDPTEEATEATPPPDDAEPATALFKPLSGRYSYANLPRGARQQLSAQLGGIEEEPIIHDVATKYVKKGRIPVAAVIAVRFSNQATPADLRGFARGVAGGTGGKARPARVGGKQVTFIKGPNAAFVYMGDDFSLLFFGTNRANLQPVVAKMLANVD